MTDPLAPLRKAPGIVRLHGHRAARGVLPENTMMAFRHVFDIGVKVVELDVLSTKDGVPVITHNPQLMAASTRDRNGHWLPNEGPGIFELSFDQLQTYDVGGLRAGTGYATRYPDQAFLSGLRIPKLADLAALVQQPPYDDIWLNVEIKSHPNHPEFTPPVDEFTDQILTVLEDFGLTQRCIVQSFDWNILTAVKKRAPTIPRSHLTYAPKANAPMESNVFEGSLWMAGASLDAFNGSLPDLIADLGGSVWSPYFADITKSDVARAQELGLIVNAWTVNEVKDIQNAIDAGVDGIITDYPGRAQRLLLENGLNWVEPDPVLVKTG